MLLASSHLAPFGPADPGTLPKPKPGEKFGGIVTMPGFTEPDIAMEFFGKRMASHGFIVLRAESLTPFDEPNVRSRAVENAMKRLTRGDHKASEILDPDRLALIGHSMGGGGVLIAAERPIYAGIQGAPYKALQRRLRYKEPAVVQASPPEPPPEFYAHIRGCCSVLVAVLCWLPAPDARG